MNRCALALLIVGLLVSANCGDDEAARVTQRYRQQFRLVMESKLRQLESGIGQLAGSASGSDSAYALEITNLQRTQERVREDLRAMETASGPQWHSLKDSVEVYYRIARDEYAAAAMRATHAGDSAVDSVASRTN